MAVLQRRQNRRSLGVDVALEYGVVGLKPRAEFEIPNAVVQLFEFWLDPGLELVDIGTWYESDLDFRLASLLREGLPADQRGKDQNGRLNDHRHYGCQFAVLAVPSIARIWDEGPLMADIVAKVLCIIEHKVCEP
jgi:hypothetical protein